MVATVCIAGENESFNRIREMATIYTQSTTWFLNWTHTNLPTQTASQSFQPFLLKCGRHTETQRQTTMCDICSNSPHLALFAACW